MRRLIAITAFMCPLLAAAQSSPSVRVPVQPDDSVRIVMRGGARLEGRLLTQHSDSLTLHVSAGGTVTDTTVATAELQLVEVSVRRRAAIKGFAIGLLTGAAAGGIAAASSASSCTGDVCGLAFLAVPFYAAIGGGVGLIIGGLHTTERWEVVWQPRTAMTRRFIGRTYGRALTPASSPLPCLGSPQEVSAGAGRFTVPRGVRQSEEGHAIDRRRDAGPGEISPGPALRSWPTR